MKQCVQWVKTLSPLYLASAGVLLIAVGILAVVALFSSSPEVGGRHGFDMDTERRASVSCTHHRALDGVCVDTARDTLPPFVAVMIENHYDARPLSGLSQASVVYEVPVEANFTRFLAIYPGDQGVEKVGPVRSARPYYLDWVSEYPDALYMHVGGSPDALSLIRQYDIFDMNEMFRGWYFWRSTDRYAPHNTYTSSALWQEARMEYTRDGEVVTTEAPVFRPWIFAEQDACIDECVEHVDVTFSGEVYKASWRYTTSIAQYIRSELGEVVVDREDGTPIVADTLVIQYVDTTVLDNVGRLGMDTIGSGEAIVFRNGFQIDGSWKKDSRTERTLFFDTSGNEIPFKAGKIWIEVVNRVDGVSVGNG